MIKNLLLFLLLLLLFSCSDPVVKKSSDNGQFDISGLHEHTIIALDGEWFFWPEQLLEPSEVAVQISSAYESTHPVPGVWQKIGLFESFSSIINSGTLACYVTLDPDVKEWGMRIPNALSAFEFYVNDELLEHSGKVSSNILDFVPSNKLAMVYFPAPEDSTILLTLRIANFSTPYTGTWDSILIGEKESVANKRLYDVIFTSIITGALIFMGLYHLTLYLLRSKDTSTLWFGLICIFMAIRNAMMGERLFLELLPESWAGWRIGFNIEHLSAHMVLPLFFLFFKRLFPNFVHDTAVKIVVTVAGLWAVLQIFTPISFHHLFLPYYEYFLILAGLYIISMIVFATIKKEEGAIITIIGMLVLLGTSVNDVLLSTGVIQTFYMASLGVFLYTFIQAFYLSMRFSHLFTMVQRYSQKLEALNNSLERFIPHEVLQFLAKDSIVDVELGDYSEEEMSVFFLDIRDFTSFSETLSPDDNFKFINSFLQRFGPIIREADGFVDKYIGDGIMALFPGNPDSALTAALTIRDSLDQFNERRIDKGRQAIRVGMGINTGVLMLGTIGENRRMDSTVISDTVNTASRLEDLCKQYDTDLLISQETVSKLDNPNQFELEYVCKHQIKGKAGLIDIYKVDWSKR